MATSRDLQRVMENSYSGFGQLPLPTREGVPFRRKHKVDDFERRMVRFENSVLYLFCLSNGRYDQ